LKERSEKIAAMLDVFNRYIDTHITEAQTCFLGDAAGQDCQAFLLGQLIRISASLSKHLRPSVSDIHCGVREFRTKLMAIRLNSYHDKNAPSIDHTKCNIGKRMLEEIKQVYNAVPSPDLDSYHIHLQEQWKKGNFDPGFT
jgi:hypothetical protein